MAIFWAKDCNETTKIYFVLGRLQDIIPIFSVKLVMNQFYFYDQATCHVTKTRFNPAEIEKSVMIDEAKCEDITNGAATSHQMIGTTGSIAGDSGS